MVNDSNNFKEFPEINPKTNEKTKMFICLECGSITATRKLHSVWHKNLYNKNSSQSPFWSGVDDLDL